MYRGGLLSLLRGVGGDGFYRVGGIWVGFWKVGWVFLMSKVGNRRNSIDKGMEI